MNRELIKGLIFMAFIAYSIYLLHYRREFRLSQGIVFSIVLSAFSVSILMSMITEQLNSQEALSLGYVALVFFALSFGEIGGIASGFGVSLGCYLQSGDPNALGISFVASTIGGFVIGRMAKRDSSFSNLILGSVLGITLILGVYYIYFLLSLNIGVEKAYEMGAPLVTSATTGVLIGTGVAAFLKKWEKWPDPIERI
jgi:uncharacterized membrane protein